MGPEASGYLQSDAPRIKHPGAGSFGSLAADGVDGGLAVLGEVFEPFDRLEAEPPQERQRRIAQGGEHLRGVASVGARLILAAGNIADIMQLVLDAPMLA